MKKLTPFHISKAFALTVLLPLAATGAQAQTHGVVASLDTRLPLRDARIATDRRTSATTDYLGRFILDAPFRSASISCKGYLTRRLRADEFQADTLFLIPLAVKLQGVEIVAPRATRNVEGWMRSVRSSALSAPSAGCTFDFFSLFDRRVRHVSAAERAKQKKVLDNY